MILSYLLISFDVEEMFIERNFRDANRTSEDITRFVFHSTRNLAESADADNNVKYFGSKNKYKASAHYVIDATRICQAVEDKDIAWHTGSRWGNKVSIGCELCENYRSDRDSAAIFTQSKQLGREKWKKYPNIIFIRHYDVKSRCHPKGKICPIWFCKNEYQTQAQGDQKWIKFLEEIDVLNLANGDTSHIAETSAKLLGIPYSPKPVFTGLQ